MTSHKPYSAFPKSSKSCAKSIKEIPHRNSSENQTKSPSENNPCPI
ncbi:hypothetical protein [Candidatus Deianiraea vastatrix]|nr:hypothetical protein [Candidatus Deianiraea vastatrix]